MKIVHHLHPAAEEFAENFSETAGSQGMPAVAFGMSGTVATNDESSSITAFFLAWEDLAKSSV